MEAEASVFFRIPLGLPVVFPEEEEEERLVEAAVLVVVPERFKIFFVLSTSSFSLCSSFHTGKEGLAAVPWRGIQFNEILFLTQNPGFQGPMNVAL